MITSYPEFIKENIEGKATPEDFGITEYKWDGEYLNCFQDVDLHNNDLKTIPFKYGKVDGFFDCSNNKDLVSLSGSPFEVTKSFYCNDTRIKNFSDCPKIVGMDFWYAVDKDGNRKIEDYPLCIIEGILGTKSTIYKFISKIVKENRDRFLPLLDNKIAFHQQVMRIAPEMMEYYVGSGIPIPKKSSFI